MSETIDQEAGSGLTRRQLGIAAAVVTLAGVIATPAMRASAAEGWAHPFNSRAWYNDTNPFGAYDPATYPTPPHKHRGSDFVHAGDGVIRSVRSGQVVYAGRGIASGELGNVVAIQHDTHWSLYAHMANGSTRVGNGDWLPAGTALGQMGATGNAYGAHLHIEIGRGGWDGSRSWTSLVDPYPLVGVAGSPPVSVPSDPNGGNSSEEDEMTTFTPVIIDRSRGGMNDESHPDFASTGIIIGDRFVRTSVGRADRGSFQLCMAAFGSFATRKVIGTEADGFLHGDINLLAALSTLQSPTT